MCDDQEAVVKAQAAQHRGFIWQFLGAPSWIIYVSTCFSHRKYGGAMEAPCFGIVSWGVFGKYHYKYGHFPNSLPFDMFAYCLTVLLLTARKDDVI